MGHGRCGRRVESGTSEGRVREASKCKAMKTRGSERNGSGEMCGKDGMGGDATTALSEREAGRSEECGRTEEGYRGWGMDGGEESMWYATLTEQTNTTTNHINTRKSALLQYLRHYLGPVLL